MQPCVSGLDVDGNCWKRHSELFAVAVLCICNAPIPDWLERCLCKKTRCCASLPCACSRE